MPAPPSGTAADDVVLTDVPARLDALPWTSFHTRVVAALGITWILDGLEVTLAGAVAGALREDPSLRLTEAQVGLSASAYLAGAVVGALLFGWLTDRLGRRRLFWITLGTYLVGTGATAFAHDFATFAACRALTGAGIGGEYAAINSAIQELVPARYRGRTDLVVNGSFWIGAAFGALGAIVLLDPAVLPAGLGWRAAFGIGAVLGLAILALRRHVPESPRWLVTHGRFAEADAIVASIEAHARRGGRPAPAGAALRLHAHRGPVTLRAVLRELLVVHRRRAAVGLVLMASQAFFYNAIFFTWALVLGRFFGVAAADVGLYLLPFALGNFLGPVLLGPLFDTVGRRPMIAVTYLASGVLLAATAALFASGRLDATGQTIAWCVVFFFASAAASSAYLTVGETFPLEMRGLAIAVFYAIGTAVGGVAGPWILGELIGTGERTAIAWGYGAGAALMVAAAAVQWRWGVAAENRSLEDVARPMSGADA
jgi:MFS family permease